MLRTYSIRGDEGSVDVVFVARFYEQDKCLYASTHDPEHLEQLIEDAEAVIISDTYLHDDDVIDTAVKFVLSCGGDVYPSITVQYCYERCYGGAEEGGWYYTAYTYPTMTSEQNRTIIEKHQEGVQMSRGGYYTFFDEFILGENQTKGIHYYC
jgi:hypothetical protein